MNRFFSLLITGIILALSPDPLVLAEENSTINDKSITGVIVRVDVKNRSVYVREN